MTPEPIVLTLNSGSSSLKFGVFAVGGGEPTSILAGEVEGTPDAGAALDRIAERIASADLPSLTAIGHRIVHGGPALSQHCRIDAAVIATLEAAIPFAPLHLPASLALIAAATARYPDVPQVACFDTVFHATLPAVAHILPLPKALLATGIRRYGFHGLSCASIVRSLGDALPERLIIAHLGHGASITAVQAGRSVDTSMGLTPSGGVMMGTRTGDIDPGVLIHLMRTQSLDASELENLVDRRAGMLGVSGLSGDMRRLHSAAPENADAALAIDMFCYAVRKQIAAMIAVQGGVDMLVFTGGIGENDGIVRARICAGLGWAGIGDHKVRVIASRENAQIALHTQDTLPGRRPR